MPARAASTRMASSSDHDGPDPERGSREAGTREYPPGTEEYSPGTEEYSPGTEEYSPGTEEYPSDTGRVGVDGSGPDEPQSVEKRSKPQPWWEREGYSSLAEVLAEQKAIDDRVWGRKPRDLRGLSLEEVVFSEPERPPSKRQNSRVRARQVNVKLTDDEHSKLQEAARGYGLAPATLARAFIVRATELALKHSP
jgi:hypothetical protein